MANSVSDAELPLSCNQIQNISEESSDEKFDQESQHICNLLPFLKSSQVFYKLKANFKLNNLNYKTSVLESCIDDAFENGHPVNEIVFTTLEKWQKEETISLERTCEDENGNSSFSSNQKIDLIAEIYPNLDKELIKEDVMNCQNPNNLERIILKYSKGDSSSHNKTLEITKVNSSLKPVKDEGCEIVEVIKKTPIVINLDDDILSPPSDNEVLVVKEFHQLEKDHDNLEDINFQKSDSSRTDSVVPIANEVKVLPCKRSGIESYSPENKDIKYSLPINVNSCIDVSQAAKATKSNAVENTFDAIVELKELNLLANVNATALQINNTDINMTDTITTENTEQLETENFQDNMYVPVPVSKYVTIPNDGPNCKQEQPNEDIDGNPIPWQEANAICSVLPFFELNNVHQSLLDNYFNPERKSKVLGEYIELAFENGFEITEETFETLASWQSSRKRPSTTNFNDQVLPKKKCYEKPPPLILNVPSTSHENLPIPTEQNLPATPVVPYLPNSLNNVPFYRHIYKSICKESKDWYDVKVDLIADIIPSLTKENILSEIINCHTETDIIEVTERLLEQQVNVNVPIKVENLDDLTDEINNDNTEATGSNNSSMGSENSEDTGPTSAADVEDKIEEHIQQLGEMFCDADPDFLAEKVNEIAGNDTKFVELIVQLTDNKDYPKMEEYLNRQQKMETRKKFLEGMSVEEFLKYFEDPEKVFSDTTKEMSNIYIKNARFQLLKDFPFHLSKVIDLTLRKHNYHYLPTLRDLKKVNYGGRKTKRNIGVINSGDFDDIFLKEICYSKMEEKIKEYHKNKEQFKKLQFKEAKELGTLKECQCCFDDEVLDIDMMPCENEEDPHKFCNSCIRRFCEEEIGQGKVDFSCLNGECKNKFSPNTLKQVLKPSIFSNLLKRMQTAEIAAAGIQDLESCPFCNFATIMPNKEDKVFKCLAPECLKDSCRLCHEPDHIPLRCEEVEKKKQTDARTFLENEMSEAMVRECYKCKKRFIKEEGCNKMRCTCGAIMCYICKTAIKGYDHFDSDSRRTTKSSPNGKCPLWSNSLKLHAEEVQQRAKDARKNLDPDVDLIHDPTKDLPQVPDYLKKPPKTMMPHNNLRAMMDAAGNDLHPNPGQFGQNLHGIMADYLFHMYPENRRHVHQHRHHHFYIPMDPTPPIAIPQRAGLPPPAHQQIPRAGPPPPAHQQPPRVPDLQHRHFRPDPQPAPIDMPLRYVRHEQRPLNHPPELPLRYFRQPHVLPHAPRPLRQVPVEIDPYVQRFANPTNPPYNPFEGL